MEVLKKSRYCTTTVITTITNKNNTDDSNKTNACLAEVNMVMTLWKAEVISVFICAALACNN